MTASKNLFAMSRYGNAALRREVPICAAPPRPGRKNGPGGEDTGARSNMGGEVTSSVTYESYDVRVDGAVIEITPALPWRKKAALAQKERASGWGARGSSWRYRG